MIKRKFLPGSEWLYLKIYTGVKTLDTILQQAVAPFVDYCEECGYISKWFFIRYHDPQSHIRLRLHLNDFTQYNIILDRLNNDLQSYIDSGEITSIAIDSYTREIERYGENTIIQAEEIFFNSSKLVINFLDWNDEEKLMISMFYIDKVLEEFKLSNHGKLTWLFDYNREYKKEFNADKNLNVQLLKKFNLFKKKYLLFLNSDGHNNVRDSIILNIHNTRKSLQFIEQSGQLFLPAFFQSIFHMHINRTFISEQRLFELIIYDYLLRYYKEIHYVS